MYPPNHPQQQPQPYPYPPMQPAIMVMPVKSSGLAVASMILGLCTFVTFGASGIPAVICGVLALRDIKTRNVPGQGMAITGLIFGGLAVFGWAAFWGMVFLGQMMGPR